MSWHEGYRWNAMLSGDNFNNRTNVSSGMVWLRDACWRGSIPKLSGNAIASGYASNKNFKEFSAKPFEHAAWWCRRWNTVLVCNRCCLLENFGWQRGFSLVICYCIALWKRIKQHCHNFHRIGVIICTSMVQRDHPVFISSHATFRKGFKRKLW